MIVKDRHLVSNNGGRKVLFSSTKVPQNRTIRFRVVDPLFSDLFFLLSIVFRTRIKPAIGIEECIDWYTN
ncbi:Uncharacterised protein [Burkholderia pseudomallei]|nr:Uncharacterised protein [Burkholderia pseudomallei]